MKHNDEQLESLICLSQALGVLLTRVQAAALLDHLAWVLQTNQTHNLTAIQDFGDALRLHVLDSVAAELEVNDAPSGALLDLGSGGGFPGVPLSIVTGRPVTLLDSVAKKVRMVGEYAEQRGLQVTVAPVRAEDHARTHSGAYAVVVARAVSQLPSLVELAAPLLTHNGVLIALKGAILEEELTRGDAVGRLCGMERRSVRRFALPAGDEERAVVTYRRTQRPSVDLPRRVGLAQKRPLA